METVRCRMSSPVITVTPETTVEKAFELMRQKDIRHLPVVKNGGLVGLVTERSLQSLLFPSMIAGLTVAEAMVDNPLTIAPDESLEVAARLCYTHKIGCLPVVEDGRVIGVLAVPDLLAAFIEFLGLLGASVTLDLMVADREDALEEVMGLIRRQGGRVLSVGLVPDESGRLIHSVRLTRQEVEPLKEALEAAGLRVVSVLT